MSNVVAWIVLVALLGGIGYGLYVLITMLVSERRRRAALSPERRAHEDAVRAADKAIVRAERDHGKAVKTATKELERARQPVKIASLDGITLLQESIATPGGMHPLTADVQARADSAGALAAYAKSRSTLTRMGAGGLVLGPIGMLIGATAKKSKEVKVDTRELYVLIEADTWAETVKVDPNKGTQARALAQAINVAARNVEHSRAERIRRVNLAQARLHTVQGDRSSIESARQRRAHLQPGPMPTADVS